MVALGPVGSGLSSSRPRAAADEAALLGVGTAGHAKLGGAGGPAVGHPLGATGRR